MKKIVISSTSKSAAPKKRAVATAPRQKRDMRKNTLETFESPLGKESYKVDLSRYLQEQTYNTDPKTIRGWAVEYAQSLSPKANVERATDYELRSLGILSRVVEHLKPVDRHRLVEDFYQLDKKYQAIKQVAKQEKTKKIENIAARDEKNVCIAEKCIEQFDAKIDEYLKTKKGELDFAAQSLFQSENASWAATKLVAAKYEKLLEEIEEVISDDCPQLKEAYGHWGKIGLRRFKEALSDLVNSCKQQKVLAPAKRTAVRKKREKTPQQLVAKLGNLPKTIDEFNLKTDQIHKLIGASVAWFYDNTKRALVYFEATGDEKLSVLRTSLIGFDIAKSGAKRLRNPGKFFAENNLAKVSLKKSFDSLSTKLAPVSGRVNNNMLLLKVY